MNKKYINKPIKDYDINKYLKKNKSNKIKKPKKPKKPTETADEVDVLQITLLFEVKDRLDLEIEKDLLNSAVEHACITIESVGFSFGDRINGFGTRAVILEKDLGKFLMDLGIHLDTNQGLLLKEIDMASGKALVKHIGV